MPPPANPFAVESSRDDAPGDDVVSLLSATRPWVLLMGLITALGVTCSGCAGLLTAGLGAAGVSGAVTQSGEEAATMLGVGAVYLVFTVAGLPQAWWLFRYAQRIRQLTLSPGQEQLVAALGAQRSLWRYTAFMVLLSIALYALLMLSFVLFGAWTLGGGTL